MLVNKRFQRQTKRPLKYYNTDIVKYPVVIEEKKNVGKKGKSAAKAIENNEVKNNFEDGNNEL